MISALVHWPSGPVRLRWVRQPGQYSEPVTAVHCFCFSGDQLILVDVAGRGASIPGGHVLPGESLLDCLQRELLEEACVTIDSPVLLGAVECDHSENPAFAPGFIYPRLASQLLYAGTVNRILPFAARHETSRRMFIPVTTRPQQYHEWDEVFQAAFDDALSWRAGLQVAAK
ncbi:MAG TPA: NUDIX domain-containing protein [Chloroflexota bacterium]|nr:NUDIX domain-containing protein [Chloroflexota bacterium]HUM67502.1 NUDIX domain-containing protein [Chloroflexota bacterium]